MRKAMLLAAAWFLSLAPASWAMDPDTCVDYHWWGRLDYLYWRAKDLHVPPLVTSGNPIGNGVIDANGTAVLVGDHIGYDAVGGARVISGLWFDSCATVGFEGSAFFLGTQSQHQAFGGDITGNPIFSIPFLNTGGQEDAVRISNPASNVGSAFVNNSVSFYGGSADLILVPHRTPTMESQFLFGFRSLYLKEDLNLSSFTTPLFVPSTTIFRSDFFGTRNFFYGGEVGLRCLWHGDVCFLEAGGKLGVGNNFQMVNIKGVTNNVPVSGFPSTTPMGIFAQENNSGRFTRNAFCLVPEVEARVGLELSSNLKLSVGYDFVLMSNVVRPGDQIDRVIGPVLNEPSRPRFDVNSFHTSSFYAHGLSVGLELRF